MPRKGRVGLCRYRVVGQNDTFVWSRTAEAAAKKFYRANKMEYAAAGTIVVADESGAQNTFKTSDWCMHGSNKFQPKPKAL